MTAGSAVPRERPTTTADQTLPKRSSQPVNLNRPPILSALAIIILSLSIQASAEWKEQVLYSFQGGSDAATPAGGVVFDKQGNLYGAAQGGTQGEGTVFQLAPPQQQGGAWTESVLYSFQGKAANDGGIPEGGLVIDGIGNLYGVTAYGGSGGCILAGSNVGCGTVYEISPPKQKGGQWTETILYSFKGDKDGYVPNGYLVFDKGGDLYGATTFGGGYGTCNSPFYQYCGTVFEVSPPKQKDGKWTEKVLYSFKSGNDGANPNGGLVLDGKGVIYGTSWSGGGSTGCNTQWSVGCGTVFELRPPTNKDKSWAKRILYRFEPYNNYGNGDNPAAGVTLDTKGNLYGTAEAGGTNGNGVVFSVNLPSGKPRSWTESVLHRFTDGSDGQSPMAAVTFDTTGNLYGTAAYGNPNVGDVFEMTPPQHKGGAWTFRVVYDFVGSQDGEEPASNLVLDKEGNLYSTTQFGGTGQGCGYGGCGTVFQVTP
jgi:uncharacterized repeat protein (TIGR03803 family)